MAKLPAGVRKKGNSLEKRFTVDGKQYSVYGKTVKELNDKEIEKRMQLEKHNFTDNKKITLDTYFEEWIKMKSLTVKPNSIRLYKSLYKKHISPMIGEKKIATIKAKDLLNMQHNLLCDMSTNSINTLFVVLNMIFSDAINAQIITNNPAANIKALKRTEEKASQTIHRALTIEEQEDFMKALKGNHYYEMIAFLLCTGMRFGEAAALTWNDIDYKRNEIMINKTVSRDDQGKMIIENSPKSKAGNRSINMNDQIKSILKSQRMKNGNVIPSSDSNVFYTPSGVQLRHFYLNKVIDDTLKKLSEDGKEIEYFSIHALRDTFATRFIENGGNPQTLKAILGHSSITITMDLYAHVLPSTKQEEMDSLHMAI